MPPFASCASPPPLSGDEFCNGFVGCGNAGGMEASAANLNAALNHISANGDNAALALAIEGDELRLMNGAAVQSNVTLPDATYTLVRVANDLELRKNGTAVSVVDFTGIGFSSGMGMLWYGAASAVPSGFAICDGTGGTPDMRGLLPMGASATLPLGSTGGAASHTHPDGVTGSTALTASMVPNHAHHNVVPGIGNANLTPTNSLSQERTTGGDTQYILNAGAGAPSLAISGSPVDASTGAALPDPTPQGHAHTVTTAAAPNVPPYRAWHYIIKL